RPEARGRQRRPAVVGQGAAHRGAVAARHLRGRVVTPFDLPPDDAHAADALLELLLGVAVGLVGGPGRLPRGAAVGPPGPPGGALHSALRVAGRPSETAAVTGTPTACAARPISPAGSSWAADSRLWANRARPLGPSRKTHSSSWPTSGCGPPTARTTRPRAR